MNELIAEARKVAEMYRHVGHSNGIENLLDKLCEGIRQAEAEAWDKGFTAALTDPDEEPFAYINPYREEK